MFRNSWAYVGLLSLTVGLSGPVLAGIIAPSAMVSSTPVVRTPENMRQIDQFVLPDLKFWLEKEYPSTLPEAELEVRKRIAEAYRSPYGRPETSAPQVNPLAVTILSNFEGVNQTTACGTCLPPDTHGAVGATQYTEVTNFHLDIYNKTTFALVKSVSLATFFGYTAQTLFDPRAVYDPTASRWLIAAEAFNESPTVQYQYLGVSTTSDANGSFCIYRYDVDTLNNNNFWDYPQLGFNKDYVFFTANIFSAGGAYLGANVMRLPKANLYSCTAAAATFYTGLRGTLAPSIVPDTTSNSTYLLAAPPGGTIIYKYTNTGTTFSGPVNITVPSYAVSADAPQPGTTAKLDTLDARFQNAGTQIGTSVFQVHTVNLSGFASPKFYEFNVSTNTVVQSGFFFASGTSHDFNPSIAANSGKNAFVTWSSTSVSPAVNAQIRVSGRKVTDPVGVIPAGLSLFNSATFYTGGRWGDYSAVTIDPSNSAQAWLLNEKINSSSVWGTRIGRFSL